MTDLETFILDNSNKIFRILTYKKVYTPYELDKKFSDESIYEDEGDYTLVYIIQAIELPDKDVLLKLLLVDDNDTNNYIYRKLSDISISEFEVDKESYYE